MWKRPFLYGQGLLATHVVPGKKNPNVSLVTRLIFKCLIIQNHFGVDKYF